MKTRLLLLALLFSFLNTSAQNWDQIIKQTASDGVASDIFGYSVSISGDKAIVGAINNDDAGTNSGSAYVYEWNGTVWAETKLTASDAASLDYFGYSVSISGNKTISGAHFNDDDGTNSGSAYIFTLSSSSNFAASACSSYTVPSGNGTYTSSQTVQDTIVNFCGADSIMTITIAINNNTGVDTQVACDSYTWIDENTYTASNTSATYTLTNVANCDSVVTLDLTINTVNVSTTINNDSITANSISASFQWLDCDNNYAIISGETNALFVATSNGNYAVEVTENGCVDTSSCVTLSTVGVIESNLLNNVSVYPNPTKGLFTISLTNVTENSYIIISDVLGKEIINQELFLTETIIDLTGKYRGVYFIKIINENRKVIKKVVLY
jgi:hypothetical protein